MIDRHITRPIFPRPLRRDVLILLGIKGIALVLLYALFFSHPIPKPTLREAVESRVLMEP